MKLIVCVDEGNGMLFNKRRQSRDREVVKRILDKIGNDTLWITPFSKNLFGLSMQCKIVEKTELETIGDDYFFVEDFQPGCIEESVSEIILYCWNRAYPADMKFDISLEKGWIMESEEDFKGFSHEKITERIYRRGAKNE